MGTILDDLFPVEFISDLSRIEANSKKPVYTIHKWFGRKTDAMIRGILLAMNMPQEDAAIFEEKFYAENHELLKGKFILDPFMGGGISLVNTLRLGGKAIGVDVNPVAWFITKNELQVLEEKDKNIKDYDTLKRMMKQELDKLENAVGNEIKNEYKTRISGKDGKIREVDILYVLWIKNVKCPLCGHIERLYPKMSLTKISKIDFENYNVCPACGEITRGNGPELT